VAALCLAAAARVGFGAAALPFFADTDEAGHFDLVRKFARGHWPSGHAVPRDPETIELEVFDASPEFMARPEEYDESRNLIPPSFRNGRIPPLVRDWPRDRHREAYVEALRNYLRLQANHEAQSPPAYYAAAGLWYDLRPVLGQTGARGVYWTRFLNAPLYALAVALAYGLCRPAFGKPAALAAAALAAAFPNTVFFTVNSDALSPALGGLALVLLARWAGRDRPAAGLAAAAGAAVAAAVLTKLTNAALLAPALAAALARPGRAGRAAAAREAALLAVAAGLPLLAWGLRNRAALGDWTGTADKLRQLTWTPKHLADVFHHPLFTASPLAPDGVVAYLSRLTTGFFDGDSNWHKEPARSAAADAFFLATSALLPALGFVTAFRRGPGRERTTAGLCALAVAAYVGVLTFLALRFDFGQCDHPSRAFPYFTSGRLVAGALVPFVALYARGLDALCGRRPALLAAATAAAVAMMLLGQYAYLRPALGSEYNWFHLPSGAGSAG
jgi:hypothetical protein